MAEIAANRLAAAARALMLAGQWAQAGDLLGGAVAADEGERAVLAVAAAEVAVDQDFWIRTYGGAAAISHASATLAAAPDPGCEHDIAFLRLKRDYNLELFGSEDGEPSWGPDGRDPAVLADLAGRATALRDSAPDGGRRAWSAFYAGLVADVLNGDPEAARPWYAEASTAGQEAGDDLVVSYALRHLGFLALQDGDADLAREHSRRSLELRQRSGCVPLALAQQLALAELARDAGDKAWAATVAGQVHAWASALSPAAWLVPASAGLLSSLGCSAPGGEAAARGPRPAADGGRRTAFCSFYPAAPHLSVRGEPHDCHIQGVWCP
jgi:hypothetical protein